MTGRAVIGIFLLSTLLWAQPKLEIVGGDTYDWGKVGPKDDPLKARITLKNAGTELLKIERVQPGCGCTTAPLDKTELKPGETATMDVTLRVGSATGPVTKSVAISTNDPSSPTKMLWLKAEMIRPLAFTPAQYFVFTDMRIGQEAKAVLTLKNMSSQEVKLYDIETTPGLALSLKNNTVLKPGQQVELVARVIPQQKGYYSAMVRLKTTHPEYPALEIPVYGNVLEASSPVFVPR
ncbi:MAG: DUF1573 domain-containing protein [Candidatus Kapabacteria bacterium]|nr:DUF1573 domain-containing protein [Candidatus Kapabacteria bacterium]MCS7169664.1 DUF1573 domain-containing protein [Candidatus Kapabacteria bacterium]MDW7996718.1 DUF1573 domain-containing protein [Bacteroidota bacterium]MDW8224578.1 DUF1573 domain-containing protein [Bacteroidota bacterium]